MPGEFAVRVAVALQAQLVGATLDDRIACGFVGVGHDHLLIGDEFGPRDRVADGVGHLPLLGGGAMALSGGDLDHPMQGDPCRDLLDRKLGKGCRGALALRSPVFGRCAGRQHSGDAGQQRPGEEGVMWHLERIYRK